MSFPDPRIRGESGIRGESATAERTQLARRLEAGGHGGCAYDLEAADDDEVMDVALAVVQHLQEGCGAPVERDQILAEDIQAWIERYDRDL